MGNKFRARFKRKLSDGRDFEVRDVIVNFNKLKEGEKLKPPNLFNFQKGSYIFDASCISDFDRVGNPIIEYYINDSLPIPPRNSKYPVFKDENGEYIIVDPRVLYMTFVRGEMKSVIASSQKEEKKWDWHTLVIGALMGGAIGMMVMSFLYPDLFGHVVVSHA